MSDHPGRAIWPADRSVSVQEMTIADLLARAVANHPDVVALVDGTRGTDRARSWTYRELGKRAERVAASLLERVEPGRRVAIIGPSTPEWLAVEFGAAMAGVVLVPLNTSYGVPALQHILDHADVGLVCVGRERGKDHLDRVVAAATASGVTRATLDVSVDAPLWSESGTTAEWPEVEPDDPALIQYTSGTTGPPKGVVLTHRAAVNNAILSASNLELPDHASWLNPLPLYHVNGTIFFGLGALWQASTHVLARFDPPLLLDLIERLHVDYVTAVPTVYVAMMEHEAFDRRDLSSLQLATTGGTIVPPELVRRIEERFGVELMVVYGQTEAGSMVTATRRGDSLEHKSRTVGAPLAQTEVKIVAVDDGSVVAHGEVGEICVRAPSIMQGYADQPSATADAIDSDGWLHTSDLGTMTRTGHVTITGRLRDLIIRGGENIYAREVEDLLHELEGILEAAVVGLPDDYYGEEVGAVVRIADGHRPDPVAWQQAATDRLSHRKAPKRWFVVDALPLTASGKVQKHVLLRAIEDGELPEVSPTQA